MFRKGDIVVRDISLGGLADDESFYELDDDFISNNGSFLVEVIAAGDFGLRVKGTKPPKYYSYDATLFRPATEKERLEFELLKLSS